jgi:pimeloyl-ACP methyl ester carboxylesterase
VVHPLRVGLAERGWNTLSIQLPVLARDATYNDYLGVFGTAIPRIEAALVEARALAPGPVVLLAHSCGAHMAQHWMLAHDRQALDGLDAYIGIGMGATDYGQPMREPFALDRLRVPVLDLYGETDYPAVRRLAAERLAALRRGGNPKSAQQVVADADHYFTDRSEALLDAVAAWLDTL